MQLRPFRLDDAAAVFAYASGPEVARYVSFPAHASEADSRAWLTHVEECYRRRGYGQWAIVLRAEGRVVGSVGYVRWDGANQTAELGCALARRLWRGGLMTEAMQAVVDFSFQRTDVWRMEARCDPANVGSARMIAKLGMQPEGCLRDVVVAKGERCSMQVFSVLRPEWEQQR